MHHRRWLFNLVKIKLEFPWPWLSLNHPPHCRQSHSTINEHWTDAEMIHRASKVANTSAWLESFNPIFLENASKQHFSFFITKHTTNTHSPRFASSCCPFLNQQILNWRTSNMQIIPRLVLENFFTDILCKFSIYYFILLYLFFHFKTWWLEKVMLSLWG